MRVAKQQQKLTLKNIMEALFDLEKDSTVPKNIKDRVQKIMSVLNGDAELPIKVDKAIQELDEIADDVNLQPYTRTQIWNVVSLLEKV
jgi:uncharacterized protein (UPF0147 family)